MVLKSCPRIRGEPTELENLRVRGGAGKTEDIESGSGQGKSARMYEHGKDEDLEKSIRVSKDQHGPSNQETLVNNYPF